MRIHTARRALAPLSLLALFAACQTVPDYPGEDVEVLHQGALESVQPADIVLAPVTVSAETPEVVPTASLRRGFAKALVRRRYSPLALEYVDREVVEASYRSGALDEDGVLRVEVQSWETSLWVSHGVLSVVMDAWMIDARTGEELWGGRITRRVRTRFEGASYPTEQALIDVVCDRLAEDLLEIMPARTPGA
ncbi:MAG: hypothetical protein QF903_14935 [Planctomycetota bacterium]|jgi:hypothetical protein|nr:hypothetical protein [Planctomycetota bacterium]MDP6761753.1 hypothetical protein [Planctomycetota bacterium]MDP6990765.1 hypothetical protein [Planctomycetota bacterium]